MSDFFLITTDVCNSTIFLELCIHRRGSDIKHLEGVVTMRIDGVMDRYVIMDEESDFVSVRIRIERGKYAIMESVKCLFPRDVPSGTPLSFVCNEKQTPSYTFCGEKHYRFEDFKITGAANVQAAVDFLLGMEIPGVKENTAKALVNVTGTDINGFFTKPTANEEIKAAIPRMSVKTIEAIRKRLPYRSPANDFYKALAPYQFTFDQAVKMYRHISNGDSKMSVEDVCVRIGAAYTQEFGLEKKKSVYDYAREVEADFSSTDKLAKSLGYRAYNPQRLKAFVYAIMDYIYKQGSTWASLDQIYNKSLSLVRRTAFPSTNISIHAIYTVLMSDTQNYKVEENGGKVELVSVWRDEQAVAFHTRRLKTKVHELNYRDDIADIISKETGVTFATAQAKCFGFLRRSGIKIITGNAGTGKTTVISSLLKAYRHLNPAGQIALCAPTGRAAQRMTELCKAFGGEEANIRASTIHKLLGFLPYGDSVRAEFNAANPLPADCIIVDEMSMVDIHLFALLVKAIKEEALLILCGDVDQLPSVGAGKVFRDLIESGRFETVRLDVNYRQSNDKGLIVRNANTVNSGRADIECGPDFEIRYCDNEAQIQKCAIELLKNDPKQTVLTTVRKGAAGTEELNSKLQPIINKTTTKGWTHNGCTYKEGDVILMNRNNYKAGYVNGDIGIVRAAANGHIVAQFGDDRKDLSADSLSDISLAYAMTIHKAQGSEFDSVVIVLPLSAPNMLVRNLLYTAITRAKKKVTIITQHGAIENAVQRISDANRQSSLQELLAPKGEQSA